MLSDLFGNAVGCCPKQVKRLPTGDPVEEGGHRTDLRVVADQLHGERPVQLDQLRIDVDRRLVAPPTFDVLLARLVRLQVGEAELIAADPDCEQVLVRSMRRTSLRKKKRVRAGSRSSYAMITCGHAAGAHRLAACTYRSRAQRAQAAASASSR